jgi:hypothetical protein
VSGSRAAASAVSGGYCGGVWVVAGTLLAAVGCSCYQCYSSTTFLLTTLQPCVAAAGCCCILSCARGTHLQRGVMTEHGLAWRSLRGHLAQFAARLTDCAKCLPQGSCGPVSLSIAFHRVLGFCRQSLAFWSFFTGTSSLACTRCSYVLESVLLLEYVLVCVRVYVVWTECGAYLVQRWDGCHWRSVALPACHWRSVAPRSIDTTRLGRLSRFASWFQNSNSSSSSSSSSSLMAGLACALGLDATTLNGTSSSSWASDFFATVARFFADPGLADDGVLAPPSYSSSSELVATLPPRPRLRPPPPPPLPLAPPLPPSLSASESEGDAASRYDTRGRDLRVPGGRRVGNGHARQES